MVTRILVANRGEIARRVFRTCREMGIATVAVHSTADRDQPHVGEADVAIELPGVTPAETYLDIDAVLDAAKRSGADAIHPGYGFLSENADFARAVIDAGLIWIGPDPDSIRLMGSKVEARRLMEERGMPVLPSALTIEAARSLRFPVLVKASAGGGGKGMRVVSEPADLDEAVEAAGREAMAAFGDGTLLFETYLAGPRHVEVQVLGDRSGEVVPVYERECSIQRRHQKIVEEAPSPAVDDELRSRMSDAAVEAARAVGYVGAGTVEFLLDGRDFWFLEMNTRLQVEHPVTEMITGLDLVRCQIEIARGGSVPEVPPIHGHAIEARLYAEDPANGFLPVNGVIQRFEFDPGVRVDSGVESGTEVSVHYDPMMAKVIAHGTSREEAASRLAAALRTARIHGPTNNRRLLVGILEHPEFLAGETDTGFLERHDPAHLARPLLDQELEHAAAVACALADRALAAGSSHLPGIPAGWRNSPSGPLVRKYRGESDTREIAYRVTGDGASVEGFTGEIVSVAADRVTLRIGDEVAVWEVSRYGPVRWVDSAHGSVRLEEVPRFTPTVTEQVAGSLHAPMPGKIVRVAVAEGDTVEEGQLLVVIEAMKMEHSLRSPQAGSVTRVLCRPGDQVESEAVLVVVE
ncbi:MAG TPA: biotin carboxylase N-terminal domain-containing protein [Acidimicrobiia bacterium]|nr:biotin carboxylase N-terminal domain-containing protein [Acidimicrobiia bacterium]